MGESDIILAIQQMWSAFDWHKGTWTVRREEVVEFARGLLDEQNSYKKMPSDTDLSVPRQRPFVQMMAKGV